MPCKGGGGYYHHWQAVASSACNAVYIFSKTRVENVCLVVIRIRESNVERRDVFSVACNNMHHDNDGERASSEK